jgi:hypothetical protein
MSNTGNKKIKKIKLGAETYDLQATETNVVLENDLYTYTAIGKITSASNTSPVKVDSAGETLKTIFNTVFGTQQDQQPTITTSNVKLNVSAGTTSYSGKDFNGNDSLEYGAVVEETDVTIIFTLANSATANYGYKCGDTKTPGNQTFYYPVAQQSTGNPTNATEKADLKITLPVNETASIVSGGGTLVYSSKASGSDTTNILYCNFNSSKQVKIKISLSEGSITTAQQTRYGQISASVNLGVAQKENQLTVGTAITKFLTYLGEDATETAKLSGGTKTNTAGAYIISKGNYYNYCLASVEDSLSSDINSPITNAIRFTSTSIEIPCTTPSHIWFLLPPGTTGSKKIQYEPFANTWVDAFGGDTDNTNGPIDVALQLNSGATVTYKGYYTSAKAAAGSSLNYKIVEGD